MPKPPSGLRWVAAAVLISGFWIWLLAPLPLVAAGAVIGTAVGFARAYRRVPS